MFATNITIEKKELEYFENTRWKLPLRWILVELEPYKVFTMIKKETTDDFYISWNASSWFFMITVRRSHSLGFEASKFEVNITWLRLQAYVLESRKEHGLMVPLVPDVFMNLNRTIEYHRYFVILDSHWNAFLISFFLSDSQLKLLKS